MDTHAYDEQIKQVIKTLTNRAGTLPSVEDFPSVDFESFIKAVIEQESGFDPKSRNDEKIKGNIMDDSIGLMQLQIPTARGVGNFPSSVTDAEIATKLFDPAFNILLGAKYLIYQLNRYGGNMAKAAAAYNAGTALYSKTDPTKFINQSYSDSVVKNYKGFVDEKKSPLKSPECQRCSYYLESLSKK